eukprot:2757615-Rhodomonas_salina.2
MSGTHVAHVALPDRREFFLKVEREGLPLFMLAVLLFTAAVLIAALVVHHDAFMELVLPFMDAFPAYMDGSWSGTCLEAFLLFMDPVPPFMQAMPLFAAEMLTCMAVKRG